MCIRDRYYTGVNITWQSQNKEILNDDGTLNHRPAEDTYVLMVATLSLGEATMTKAFPVLVYADTVEDVYKRQLSALLVSAVFINPTPI